MLWNFNIKGGKSVFIDICHHHPVSLSRGYLHSVVFHNEGEIIFINSNSAINSPNSPITAVYLPDREMASSVVWWKDSAGRIIKFSIVSDLSGQEIVCVSGTNKHFLTVSKGSGVFKCGSNEFSQLGLGEGTEFCQSRQPMLD